MRGGKARQKAGFCFSVQKRPVPEFSGASLTRPHLESRTEAHQGGRKSTGGSVSASSTDTRKKGHWGDSIPDVLPSTTSSSLSSSVVLVGTLPKFLDQWRSITSKMFVLNIVLNVVKGHHLELWSHPPLFHNFKWFNIKAAADHHPVI